MAKSKEEIIAYCLKTKQKEPMFNPEVVKTKRGGFMVRGTSKGGFTMCLMLSEENALKLIKEGTAKKAF